MSHAAALLLLIVAIQAWAQGTRAGIAGLYAASPCSAVPADGAVGATTDTVSLRSRAMSLAQDLPEGEEKSTAMALVDELGAGLLTRFCVDAATGDLVAKYAATGPVGMVVGGRPVELRVEPRNKSEPTIEFEISKLAGSDGFRYMYTISNGAGASRSITSWSLESGHGDQTIRMSHPTWRTEMSIQGTGAATTVVDDASTLDASQRIVYVRPALKMGPGPLVSWTTTSSEYPVREGSSLSQFQITSRYFPGWTTAYVGSDGGVTVPEDVTVPNDIKAELSTLLEPVNHFSQVIIVGPKFHAQVGRAWRAGNWHGGVQSMISQGRVSAGSTYVIELLSSLEEIAKSVSDEPPALRVRSKPSTDAEKLLDKLVRLAL